MPNTAPDINRILRNDNRPAKWGAPMGDSRYRDYDGTSKLYLQRLRLVDGDYGADGTYWGGGPNSEHMWCAFNEEGTIRIYVRGWTRQEAAEEVLEQYPDAEFYRRTKC